MTQLIAMMAGALAGWIPHALLGESLSIFPDFVLSTLFGGAAYIATLVWLRRLRG